MNADRCPKLDHNWNTHVLKTADRYDKKQPTSTMARNNNEGECKQMSANMVNENTISLRCALALPYSMAQCNTDESATVAEHCRLRSGGARTGRRLCNKKNTVDTAIRHTL